MKLYLFIFYLFFISLCFSQENILYNGDFEKYYNCPEAHVKYNEGVTELTVGWFINNKSTPDYFNRCSKNSNVGVPINFAGNMEPHSGNAYVGMILRSDSGRYSYSKSYTENLQTALQVPLERNKLYCFQFYYVLSKNSGIASNGLSVYFSNSKPNFEENALKFYFKPQLELKKDSFLTEQKKWNLFSGYFMASGEEKYISIGNFIDFSEAKYITIVENPTEEIHSFAYYLFDNFKLFKIKNAEECPCNTIMNQLDSFPEIEFKKQNTELSFKIDSGETLILKNIFFEFDKTNLLPQSNEELNKVYKILIENPEITIEISGHTDNIGTENYNIELSKARAKAVLEYLYKKGIPLQRMKYSGYGSKKPIADNNTFDGRKQNRRVEIKILTK